MGYERQFFDGEYYRGRLRCVFAKKRQDGRKLNRKWATTWKALWRACTSEKRSVFRHRRLFVPAFHKEEDSGTDSPRQRREGPRLCFGDH